MNVQAFAVDGRGALRGLTAGEEARIEWDSRERDWLEPFDRCDRDLLRVASAVHSVDRLASRAAGREDDERFLSWPRALEQLFDNVQDESPVHIEAPFIFSTKGEVCRAVGPALSPLAAVAQSCDEGERSKSDAMEHCGLCTSCLLRRCGLYAALGRQDPTRYREQTRRHGRYDVRAFVDQAKRYGTARSWTDLLTMDPEFLWAERYAISHGTDAAHARVRIAEMFQRHQRETESFVAAMSPGPRISDLTAGAAQ